MADDLEQRARQAGYEAGGIVDTCTDDVPSLEVLAESCDALGVRRPVALQEALAAAAGE